MTKPIIQVQNFSYRYSDASDMAIDDISFEINQGEFIGIIGCNRSGKSTLCKSLVGVLPYILGGDWLGSVIIDGISLDESKGEGATDIIGIVFQNAESQFTQETVEDEIAFAMCNFGYTKELMRERILQATEACGLRDMIDRSPFNLSGGQQQRLAIACILALQPRVIILDESTSQLDPVGRDEVFMLVAELHKKGTTIIMVDHNIEKIAQYVDKVMVLNEGKLVEFGDVNEVFLKKERLNEHLVRIPQVTDAALLLHKKTIPINLEDAKRVFLESKRGG